MQGQNNDHKRILAIECAVGRGSVAILDGTSVLVSSEQDAASPSRAEEILGAVTQLSASAGVALSQLDLIAVSNGPGSYSGIRIGIATGLGLKRALNIALVGVSVLEAIAGSTPATSRLVSAIPVGKKDVAWQTFNRAEGEIIAEHAPVLASEIDFVAAMSRDPGLAIFAQSNLIVRLGNHSIGEMTVVDCGEALAGLIGAATVHGFGADPQPIYLRNISHAAGAPGF